MRRWRLSIPPEIQEDRDDVARQWTRGAWVVAGVLAAVAAAYLIAVEGLIAEVQSGIYREHWRASYYVVRLDGYRWFLPALSAAAALWAMALTMHNRLGRGFGVDSTSSPTSPSIMTWAVGAGVIAVAIYFSHREWLYYEMQCWDGYCDHAALFASWFRGEENAAVRLLEYARSDYHANSLLVPLLTGLVNVISGDSIEFSYRALSAVASLGTLVILFRSLLPALGVEVVARFPAVLLVGTHLFWVRSFFYPQTDPFVMLWMTALVALTLEPSEPRTPWRAAAVIGVLIAGLFTKLSFLPALAIIPGWRVLHFLMSEASLDKEQVLVLLRKLSRDAVAFILLPAGVFLGYQYWVGSIGLYAHEFDRMATLDTSAAYHLLCVVWLVAVPGVLFGLREHPATRREKMLAAWVALYVVSLWYAHTSGWARFYLPILPVVIALAAPGLSRIERVAGPAMLWSFVGIVALLNYAALALRLYY